MHKRETFCEIDINNESYDVPVDDEINNHNSIDPYKTKSNSSPLIADKGHTKENFLKDKSMTKYFQKFSKSQEVCAEVTDLNCQNFNFQFQDFQSSVINPISTKTVALPHITDTPVFFKTKENYKSEEGKVQKRKKSRLALIRKSIDPRNSSTQILSQLETINHICNICEKTHPENELCGK